MSPENDSPKAGLDLSNIVRLRRSRDRIRLVPGDSPLTDNEQGFTWEHWAIGLVMAGSFVWSILVLIG